MDLFERWIGDVGLLTLLFIPVHQGLIELYKLLGAKVRRYYEALAWIVYGHDTPSSDPEVKPVGLMEGFRTGARLVPEELGPACRRDWVRGVQRRLIESFVLRAVGDSPVAEVSDADIENVVAVVRAAAPPEVRRTVEVLEGLLESGISDPEAAARALGGIEPKGRVEDEVRGWIAELTDAATSGRSIGPLLAAWRRSFLERHLPGELRARTGLASALKSAELRYHRDLARVSGALAAVEAIAVCLFVGVFEGGIAVFLVTALVPFGVLLLAPRVTKALLDAVIGVGTRLRG